MISIDTSNLLEIAQKSAYLNLTVNFALNTKISSGFMSRSKYHCILKCDSVIFFVF